MMLGDFTDQAKYYMNRPDYSETVLQVLKNHIEASNGSIHAVADVGAGTGKLTEGLASLGLSGFAVEPNDAMREEGIKALEGRGSFVWSKGAAEATGLPDHCVDWVLMGNSFHWTDASTSLQEFHRILRPGGYFTAVWNARELKSDPLQMEIESKVWRMIPDAKQLLGTTLNLNAIRNVLLSVPYFGDLFSLEASHSVEMSKERYIGVWRSLNYYEALAGAERFEEVLQMIKDKIRHLDQVVVPYFTRAFTVQSLKG